jgi:hypothetical protein
MVSLELQIKAVEREIGMRLSVYPKWVEKRKMSQEKADFEIEAMRAVLETLNTINAHNVESPDH